MSRVNIANTNKKGVSASKLIIEIPDAASGDKRNSFCRTYYKANTTALSLIFKQIFQKMKECKLLDEDTASDLLYLLTDYLINLNSIDFSNQIYDEDFNY